jgi:hypothetical protein
LGSPLIEDYLTQMLNTKLLKKPYKNTTKLPNFFPISSDLAKWLERLIVNVVVVTVLGSISASSDTVESEGR